MAVLEELSIHDLAKVEHLSLNGEEEAFAGGPLLALFESMALDDLSDEVHLFALRSGNEIVAFFILREGDRRPAWAQPASVTLHNLRVGQEFQGNGFGRHCLVHAAAWIRSNRPQVVSLMLSVNRKNVAAADFYRHVGFSDTGKIHVGRLGPQSILMANLGDFVF